MRGIEPDNNRIIRIVEMSLREIRDDFMKHPERFYTESDIVCGFYLSLRTGLSRDSSTSVSAAGPSIIHTEFPTPFRCKMKDVTFTRARDDERTEKGRKFKRGHFDVIVLNPSSVKRFQKRALRGQDYSCYLEEIAPHLEKDDPLILYGVEFGYDREPLSRNGARVCVKKAIQDHDKLDEAMNIPGFMRKRKTMIFATLRNPEDMRTLSALEKREGIELVMFN